MSDLISNFVNQANRMTPLTTLGQGISQVGQAVKAKRKQEALEVNYQEALSGYMEDGSQENLVALYESAGPLGKFDQIKTTIADMDSLTQKNQLQQNMEYYSGVISGNTNMTIDKLEADALANENEGDIAEAKQLRHLAQQLRGGKEKEFLSFIGGMSGLLEGGPEVLQNIRDTDANRRAQEEHTTDFVESGVGLEFQDEAHKNRVLVEANKMPDAKLATMFAEMGSIVGAEGDDLDANQLADFTFKLNKEYNSRIENYRTVSDSANNIYEAAKPDSGFSDDAILKLFNKVLDPDSVVRQSELEATLEAQGKLQEFKNILPKFGTGVTLNKETRPKLLEIVKILDEEAKKNIEGIQKEMNPIVDKYIAPNKETREKDRGLIYGPSMTAPLATSEEIPITSVSNVVPQANEGRLSALRAHVERNNPQSSADFANMSEEQLNRYRAAQSFEYAEEETVEVDY